MYRFHKFARKHQPALATATAIALCLLLGTTVSAWQAARATTAEAQANANEQKAVANEKKANANAAEAQVKAQEATDQRDEAQKQRDEVKSLNETLRRTLYTSNMNLAKTAWDTGNIQRVLEILEQHRPKLGETDLRRFEWYYLDRLCHSDLLTFTGFTTLGRTRSGIAFSPDGKRLVITGDDNLLKVHDVQTGAELLSLKGNGGGGVAFSPDGKWIAAASGREIKIWDAQTSQEIAAFLGHTKTVNSVAFSADSKRLASVSGEWAETPIAAEVKLWDAETRRELQSFKGLTGDVFSVAISPDGKCVASGNGTIKVWDSETGRELFSREGGGTKVAFGHDGKRIASGHKVWDIQNGKELLSLEQGQQITAFSADGTRLACAGRNKAVRILDSQTGDELVVFKGHIGGIGSILFSPDGSKLASASIDGTVKLWNASIPATNRRNYVSSVSFSPDGNRLAAATGGKIVVFDAHGTQELLSCVGHAKSVHCVAFSPNGQRIASASSDKSVIVWDARDGHQILKFSGHTGKVVSVVFSPDGSRLASSTGDPNGIGYDAYPGEIGEVKVWDAESGRELLSLAGHSRFVNSVTFSPDGKLLATLSRDKTVRLWDAQSGKELRSFKAIPFIGGNVVFSPDGKRLASVSSDVDSLNPVPTWTSHVKVWDVKTGAQLHALKGQSGMIQSVVFSPDGERLVAGSGSPGPGGEIKVWDALTGQEVLTLEGNVPPPNGLAFSPDGHRLAGGRGRGDGTARIWDATPMPEKP